MHAMKNRIRNNLKHNSIHSTKRINKHQDTMATQVSESWICRLLLNIPVRHCRRSWCCLPVTELSWLSLVQLNLDCTARTRVTTSDSWEVVLGAGCCTDNNITATALLIQHHSHSLQTILSDTHILKVKICSVAATYKHNTSTKYANKKVSLNVGCFGFNIFSPNTSTLNHRYRSLE
jgi:hypothetical protein